MAQHSVFVVDDHPIVRRGYIEIIRREEDLTVCGEAGTADEAMQRIPEANPELMIVDLSLDGTGGLELIKQINAEFPSIKVLVASMHDESVYAERALHAGATGYINKEQTTDHLIGAIRTVLLGKVYLSELMTERLLTRARIGEISKSPIESLTDRELEVFELLGKGLTTHEIAERISRSVKTIESHRENIKTKLGCKNSAELTHRATVWVYENS